LLSFPSKWVRGRRDHVRFLCLIAASALLHQRQRAVRETAAGRVVVAALADYAIGYEVSLEAIALAQSDAGAQALGLYEVIWRRADEIASKSSIAVGDVSFTRREVRAWAGRPDTSVRRALEELVELEYLSATGRPGQGRLVRYRVNAAVGREPLSSAERLLTPDELAARLEAAGGDLANFATPFDPEAA
ncbi:MAG: hypothetical protein ACREQY_23315, partial [Candidatus Binatia bacterium]